MIKFGEKNFLLTDSSGNDIPFNAAELQSELIYCFLSAGMRESSCFAEDIALAVEYAVHEKEHFGGRISEDELADMVVATLESADFHAVAEWFKKRNKRVVEVLFSTSPEGLREVAKRHGLLQAVENESLLNKVCNAFKLIGANQSPSGLIVEMIHFFQSAAGNSSAVTQKSKNPAVHGNYLVEIKEITESLPEVLCDMIEKKVLCVNDVTVYHPSIRLYLDIEEFAKMNKIEPLLTEMLWMPFGAELGQCIDAAIEAVQLCYNNKGGKKQLPVYLTVNRMGVFVEKYFGAATGHGNKLAAFLIENLNANMFYKFYKVRF